MSLTYISNHYQWKQLCSQALAGKVVGGGKPLLYTHLIVNWREAGSWKVEKLLNQLVKPSQLDPLSHFFIRVFLFTKGKPPNCVHIGHSKWAGVGMESHNVFGNIWECGDWGLRMDFDAALSEAGELGLWQWGVRFWNSYIRGIQSYDTVKSQIHPQWPSASPNIHQGALVACSCGPAAGDVERSLCLCWICSKT